MILLSLARAEVMSSPKSEPPTCHDSTSGGIARNAYGRQ